MIAIIKRVIASLAAVLAAGGTAVAGFSPLGVWTDPTGRGAIEISDCGGHLCGRVVWVKEQRDQHGCNFQMMGGIKPLGRNTWGGGWIIDPSSGSKKKYDVEITPLSDQKLRVMGYEGLKIFSETMTLTRAPSDLKKCNEEVAQPGGEATVTQAPITTDDVPQRAATPEPTQPPAAPNALAIRAPVKPGKAIAAVAKPKACTVKVFGLAIPCDDLE
jgi:uncharacterized protein (DUF2147 family)